MLVFKRKRLSLILVYWKFYFEKVLLSKLKKNSFFCPLLRVNFRKYFFLLRNHMLIRGFRGIFLVVVFHSLLSKGSPYIDFFQMFLHTFSVFYLALEKMSCSSFCSN